MGLTHKTLKVKETRKSALEREVEFMVDSGAMHSLVPREILNQLGIDAYKKLTFVLADGSKVEREVGDAYFEYRREGGAAPVIFGEPGDEPLLGATTLESLGLVLNPFQRELYPARLMLARTLIAG
jgi:clan AA aspartic protease